MDIWCGVFLAFDAETLAEECGREFAPVDFGICRKVGVEVTCGAAKLAADGCGVEHGELFAQSVAEHAYLFSETCGRCGLAVGLGEHG